MPRPAQQDRTREFGEQWIKGLPLPPKPEQLDYFDTRERGLGLRVSYGGRKSFFVMYSASGKRQRFTLGEHGRLEDGRLSLQEARRQAKARLGGVAGRTADPAAEARASRQAATVATIAADWIKARKDGKRSKSWKRQEAILRRDILPAIGHLKGRDLTRGDVKAMLRKIKDRPAPVLANRAHEIIRAMLNWALLEDEYGLEANVALKMVRNAEKPRDRWLTNEPDGGELGAYWKALDAKPELPEGISKDTRAKLLLSASRKADCLRLCLLTAQRQQNVLGMHRDQILVADKVWLVPAGDAKTDVRYKVPLSAAAVEIVDRLLATAENGWLFPNRDGDGPVNADSPWHKDAHTAACTRAGIKPKNGKRYGLHGHRHSFGTHCDLMEIPRYVWNKGVLHPPSPNSRDMADVYSGADFERQRRDCMERWAERIAIAASENVVEFKKPKRRRA